MTGNVCQLRVYSKFPLLKKFGYRIARSLDRDRTTTVLISYLALLSSSVRQRRRKIRSRSYMKNKLVKYHGKDRKIKSK